MDRAPCTLIGAESAYGGPWSGAGILTLLPYVGGGRSTLGRPNRTVSRMDGGFLKKFKRS